MSEKTLLYIAAAASVANLLFALGYRFNVGTPTTAPAAPAR